MPVADSPGFSDLPDGTPAFEDPLASAKPGVKGLADWIKARLPDDFQFTPGSMTSTVDDPDAIQEATDTFTFLTYSSNAAYLVEISNTNV